MSTSAPSKAVARSKRTGDVTPKSPVAKKSRVKVVASRYAQALQNRNLETERTRRPAVGALSGSTSSSKPPKQPLVVPSALALAKQRPPPPPATASTHTDPPDLKERLKAYKASKAAAAASARPHLKPPAAAPAPPVKLHGTPRERPGLPTRIDRSVKRPLVAETTRPSLAAGGSTLRSVVAPPPATYQEELELLEALYYQLCFTERRAAQAFRQQEQAAEVRLV